MIIITLTIMWLYWKSEPGFAGRYFMKIEWVDGFEIKTATENGEIVISANREGMLSLAKQLTALADGAPGDHIHYDEYNSLENGSTGMIIVRTR